jgi:histone H3/H4
VRPLTGLSLEFRILELLEFKVRGSTLPTLAKRLGKSQEELSLILESMIDEKKLVKKGRHYRRPQVARVIHAEMPVAPCHRILIKFSGLMVSWGAVEGLRSILENISRSIATEAANSAKLRKGRTVSMGDVEVAVSKLGLPAMLYEELREAMRKDEEELTW